MSAHWLSIVCVTIAALFAFVFHPRVIFGDGTAFSVVSLDGLFFFGQWTAFMLAAVALILTSSAIAKGTAPPNLWMISATATGLLVFLVIVGIPHQANRGEWYNRKLGIRWFIKGVQQRRKENAPPVKLTADSFRGQWRSVDGAVYSFEPSRVLWTHPDRGGEYSAQKCGDNFEISYVQAERSAIIDDGIAWSVHANAVHDATSPDAKIPIMYVKCDRFESLKFIRASETEVWRWTSSLDLAAMQNDSFVLRRVDDAH